MKTGVIAAGLVSLLLLGGCQSQDVKRKQQVRDNMVNQCNMQVQMAASSGLPSMQPLCDCIASTLDGMSVEQFKAATTSPMQQMQFSQSISQQCMQRIGPSMMGGGMGGMGPGMQQPGMQQPGVGPGMYGGATEGANASQTPPPPN